MKRKIGALLLTVLLAFCTAAALSACTDQEDIDNAIDPVEQQITLINTALGEMKATDEKLSGDIGALTTRVTTLEIQLVSVNASIESLGNGLSDTKTALASLKTNLESEIVQLKAEIADLKEKDTELQGKIASLEAALEEEIFDAETWVEETFLSLEDWKKLKAEIDAKLDGLTARVATLESSLTTVNTTLRTLQSQIDKNAEDIKALQDVIECLKSCINGIHECTDPTYTWANDFSSCTAEALCKHCGNTVNETKKSSNDDYVYTVEFENELFGTRSVKINDLSTLIPEQYENALTTVFSKGLGQVSLTLPKNFDSFELINTALSNNTVGVDLTLTGVLKIPSRAFYNNIRLNALNISDSVTEIGNEAFSGSSIMYISADKVTYVGQRAFSETDIKKIELPNAQTVDLSGFADCTKLEELSIPKVTSLDSNIFSGCTSLKEIKLESVTKMMNGAFTGASLEKVTFGSCITWIGPATFSNLDTNNCVLVLAKGQKKFKLQSNGLYALSGEDMTPEDTEFAGKTFKQIIIAE